MDAGAKAAPPLRIRACGAGAACPAPPGPQLGLCGKPQRRRRGHGTDWRRQPRARLPGGPAAPPCRGNHWFFRGHMPSQVSANFFIVSPYVRICSMPDEVREFCHASANRRYDSAVDSLIAFCQLSPNCLTPLMPASFIAFCQLSPNCFMVSAEDSRAAFSMTSLKLRRTSALAFCTASYICFQLSNAWM